MILINGIAENRIEVLDRGLQYGDGLFETIAYRNGVLELVREHLERLKFGCQRLAISFEEFDLLERELHQVCQTLDSNAVIKIVVTRGSGGRGYFAGRGLKPTRIISTHPYPNYPLTYKEEGVITRLCQHKLSENPALAGIKHLNRLDQVIARNEWSDSTIAEGFMCDQHDHLIEATMSNVFIVKSGELRTPSITSAGINGVMRAKIISLAKINKINVRELVMSKDDLLNADEVFVCNSVNGIWPVVSVIDFEKTYQLGPMTKQCQTLLADDQA